MKNKKEKEFKYATYSLTITCPKNHRFLEDIDSLYLHETLYKGHFTNQHYTAYCEECKKDYILT